MSAPHSAAAILDSVAHLVASTFGTVAGLLVDECDSRHVGTPGTSPQRLLVERLRASLLDRYREATLIFLDAVTAMRDDVPCLSRDTYLQTAIARIRTEQAEDRARELDAVDDAVDRHYEALVDYQAGECRYRTNEGDT